MTYTSQQIKYIESIGDEAHAVAIEIIGELEEALIELGGSMYFDEWHRQTFPEKYK